MGIRRWRVATNVYYAMHMCTIVSIELFQSDHVVFTELSVNRCEVIIKFVGKTQHIIRDYFGQRVSIFVINAC